MGLYWDDIGLYWHYVGVHGDSIGFRDIHPPNNGETNRNNMQH